MASSSRSQRYCTSLPNHRQWQPLNPSVQLSGGEHPAFFDWFMLEEIISLVALHGKRRDSGAGNEMNKLDAFRAQNRKLYTEGRYMLSNRGHGGPRGRAMVEGDWPETVLMCQRTKRMEGKEVSVLCGRL